MSSQVRFLLAFLFCMATGVGGWFVAGQKPPSKPNRPTMESAQGVDPAGAVLSDHSLASKIRVADPFGVTRTSALASVDPNPPTVNGKDAVAWRVVATVVRGSERYIVMTTPDQPALKVTQGAKLPNGERVQSIEADHIVIKDARGKNRTIYLTEP